MPRNKEEMAKLRELANKVPRKKVSRKHTVMDLKTGKLVGVQLTPIKAIVLNCVLCMGGQAKLVEGCTSPNCPLFVFRTNKIRREG